MLLGHSTSLIQRISQTSLQMALRLQLQRQPHQSVWLHLRNHQQLKDNFTISLTAPPVSVAAPQEPSAAERELHNLTHIPFRS
eukprot:5149556-Amphidinium_carterae.1